MAEDTDVLTRRSIGQTAREARTTLRMTQAEVAEALGMAPEVYGRIERGLMMPSVLTLMGIARTLRVTPNELLGWSKLRPSARPAAYEHILTLLERADEQMLKRADAILEALLSIDRED